MARKTIAVADLIVKANHLLTLDDERGVDAQFRWGVIAMIEATLFATDQYKGFRYLPSEYAPAGSPTILREGYDETRRAYFA
jgi:hypothetical protein